MFSRYSFVHGELLPALTSPRWATRRTPGSALILSVSAGNSASLTGPYGVSPMTAMIYGMSESSPSSPENSSVDGVTASDEEIWADAAVGATGLDGVSVAHPAMATHAMMERNAVVGRFMGFLGWERVKRGTPEYITPVPRTRDPYASSVSRISRVSPITNCRPKASRCHRENSRTENNHSE